MEPLLHSLLCFYFENIIVCLYRKTRVVIIETLKDLENKKNEIQIFIHSGSKMARYNCRIETRFMNITSFINALALKLHTYFLKYFGFSSIERKENKNYIFQIYYSKFFVSKFLSRHVCYITY